MTDTYIKIFHRFYRKGRETQAGREWLKLKAIFDLINRTRNHVWTLIEWGGGSCSFVWMHNVPAHTEGVWVADFFNLGLTFYSVWCCFFPFVCLLWRLYWQVQNSQNALAWYRGGSTGQGGEGCSQAFHSEMEFYKGMENMFISTVVIFFSIDIYSSP